MTLRRRVYVLYSCENDGMETTGNTFLYLHSTSCLSNTGAIITSCRYHWLPSYLRHMYAAAFTVWVYSYSYTWPMACGRCQWLVNTVGAKNLDANMVGDQAKGCEGGWCMLLLLQHTHNVSVTVGTIHPQRFWEGSCAGRETEREADSRKEDRERWKEKNGQSTWTSETKLKSQSDIFRLQLWESEFMHRHMLEPVSKQVHVRERERESEEHPFENVFTISVNKG